MKKKFIKILKTILTIVIFFTFFIFSFSINIERFVPLMFTVLIALLIFLPSKKKRFLKLQNNLATSKISAISKGLVEIQGQLLMKSPLNSPITTEDCIGYHYKIEKVERDKDGKKSYTTIHEETQCNPFEIEDDTGRIEIIPDGIEIFLMKQTNIDCAGRKRYTETLLKQGQKMLLIGYADSNNGTPFIRKDEHYSLLGISPISGVGLWNKYLLLLQSFLFTWFIIISLIVLILLQ